jgi:hypothetical protein
MDVTGLQTFPEEYRKGMPLGTMPQWAWHLFPNSGDYKFTDIMKAYDSHGREVFYPVGSSELRVSGQALPEQTTAAAWLRDNPHRIHLARLGLVSPSGMVETPRLQALSLPTFIARNRRGLYTPAQVL